MIYIGSLSLTSVSGLLAAFIFFIDDIGAKRRPLRASSAYRASQWACKIGKTSGVYDQTNPSRNNALLSMFQNLFTLHHLVFELFGFSIDQRCSSHSIFILSHNQDEYTTLWRTWILSTSRWYIVLDWALSAVHINTSNQFLLWVCIS